MYKLVFDITDGASYKTIYAKLFSQLSTITHW